MSFILDALKKSETDRQRQASPALFEVKVATPRRKFPLWAAALAVLLGVNVLALGLGAAAQAGYAAWRRRPAPPRPPPSRGMPRRSGHGHRPIPVSHRVQRDRRPRTQPAGRCGRRRPHGTAGRRTAARRPGAGRAAGLRCARLPAGAHARTGRRDCRRAAQWRSALARRGARPGQPAPEPAAGPARLRRESGRSFRVHQHAQAARRRVAARRRARRPDHAERRELSYRGKRFSLDGN